MNYYEANLSQSHPCVRGGKSQKKCDGSHSSLIWSVSCRQEVMKISFDLDDTLIPAQRIFETERLNWLQRLLGIEPIRLGAVQLMKQLQSNGHDVCIYTTSFRKILSIRLAFWTYGIFLDEVVNQAKHDRTLREKRNVYSKYPPAFGIDFHVDDSPGVAMEGQRFKFKTLIIKEDEASWILTVHQAVGTTGYTGSPSVYTSL
jgi:hypothetical protein